MYFVVILVTSRELLALPASHIYNLDIVRKINGGLKNWKKQLVFFSSENHDPNFNLELIREDFDENVDGLYWANILKAFDTKAQAESYIDYRRNVLPVNYFDQPAEQDNLDEMIDGAIDPGRDVKRQPVQLNSEDATLFPSDASVYFTYTFV